MFHALISSCEKILLTFVPEYDLIRYSVVQCLVGTLATIPLLGNLRYTSYKEPLMRGLASETVSHLRMGNYCARLVARLTLM